MANDDPLANRDRALRRLSGWTVAALGGGCALTGFFAAQAAAGFTGSSSSNTTPAAIAPTPTAPAATVPTQAAPGTRPRVATAPTTTLAPSKQIPIQPPQGGVQRSKGRSAGRSGGS